MPNETHAQNEATHPAICPACDGDGCFECNYTGTYTGYCGHHADIVAAERMDMRYLEHVMIPESAGFANREV